VVGPQPQLSIEQSLAIQTKLAADPGVRRTPTAEARAVKPTGPPPAVAAQAISGAASGSASLRPKPSAWPTISPSIGPIPRPSWSEPWFVKKPADVTISRPLRPEDAARSMRAAGAAGGQK
jgi:hypothetical protein